MKKLLSILGAASLVTTSSAVLLTNKNENTKTISVEKSEVVDKIDDSDKKTDEASTEKVVSAINSIKKIHKIAQKEIFTSVNEAVNTIN